MAFELGVAYLPILPETSKIAPGIRQALVPASAKAADESGEKFKSGFGAKLKGLAAPLTAAFAGAAVTKVIGDSIREASNLSESINAVRVSYGNAAKDILKIGESSAKSFGLSKSEFNGFAVQFQSFSKTIAGADGDVSKTFDSILGRATDFASVMNLDVNEAARLFQSGLAGETEPLRKYGIDLSAAAVEAYAMANGIGEAGRQLTEQEKVQARYGLLMESTSKTQGDFANTSDGLANKQRILGAQWKDLKAKAGKALVPALTSVTGAFSDMVPKIEKGVKIAWDYKEIIAILAGGLIAYKGAMIGAAAYQAIYAAGTGAATAGTWSLNAALRANPIGLVVTALTLLGVGLVMAYKKSETFRDIVNGAWAAIKTGLSFAWSYIQPVFAAIGNWLGVVLPRAFDFIKAYISVWWAVVQAVFTVAVWYVQNILAPVFTWLWQNIIKPAFDGIGTAISWAWNNVINPAFGAIKSGVGFVAEAFGKAKDGITAAWDKLGDIVRRPINGAVKIINWFLDMIDKIPGVDLKFRLGEAPAAPSMVGAAANGFGFAEGGWTGPGGKYTPAGLVHADEFVVKKSSRRSMERTHPGLLGYINATGSLPGYAEGGTVVPGKGNRHTSGYSWATWAGDFPNPVGTPVRAWKDGVIALVKTLTGSYGKHIRMNHTDGTSSLYAHLRDFTASVGDQVRQGDMIGRVGSTGNSTGPHLHFESMGGLYKGGSGGGGGSVWDTFTGAAGQITGWIKDHLIAKADIGGIFGNVGELFRHLGNGVKDHVLGKLFPGGAKGLLDRATSMPGTLTWAAKKLFDAGGLAHGTGLLAKNTIAPERVLSDRQTRAFEQMVRQNFGDGAARPLASREDLDYLADRIVNGVLIGSSNVTRNALEVRSRAMQGARTTAGVTY